MYELIQRVIEFGRFYNPNICYHLPRPRLEQVGEVPNDAKESHQPPCLDKTIGMYLY